ncbi:hypothetical protein Btru_058861 [Bulinus truncatus]|nr:hypothetical protein Btru_058861 [Bulinus truncatus]
MEGLGMSVQEPEEFQKLTDHNDHVMLVDTCSSYSLQELNPKDRAYKEIQIDFENAGLTVILVEKLYSAHLCQQYLTERKLILDRRLSRDPDFKLNEKFLYHGTSAKKSYICEESLDSRMSKQGCFGKGIYFSDYPKKCLKYAEKGGGNEHFILLTRVILGESKVYPKGAKQKDLVREPEKEAPCIGHRFYDSVQGCPVNHKEFVVYDNRRVLVEYVITYQKSDKAKVGQTDSVKFEKLKASNNSDSDSSLSDDDCGNNSDSETGGNTTEEEEDNIIVRPVYTAKAAPKNILSDEVNYEELLNQKKAEFTKLTGVTDDNVIDHCLLRGNMDLDEALRLHRDQGNNIIDLPLPEVPREFEETIMKEAGRPSYPEPGSNAWSALSEDEKEVIISTFLEDFLYVTGLTETDTSYAKERLASTGYNLDLAIVAHYEDM